MASDIEFLRQRLALVEEQIAQPNAFQYQGQDRGRPRRTYHTRQNVTYRREARLLRKLLTRSHPGGVLRTLIAWRRQLGQFAADHRDDHKEAVQAHDEWLKLPRDVRVRLPEPPMPRSPRYFDAEGTPWIVDDSFLALLDDLAERLQKWLNEDERG